MCDKKLKMMAQYRLDSYCMQKDNNNRITEKKKQEKSKHD